MVILLKVKGLVFSSTTTTTTENSSQSFEIKADILGKCFYWNTVALQKFEHDEPAVEWVRKMITVLYVCGLLIIKPSS